MTHRFDGSLYLPNDDGYERARVDAVFNGRKPNRFPSAVLEAGSDSDVVAGVLLAAEKGWKVSVRAGGHSWAAWSVRDEALLIDLGRLRDMEIVGPVADPDDPYTVVRVRPSVQGGQEFTPFLDAHGLQFTGGHCSTVGLGGFVMQGGQGWNSRAWGWGCENLMAIDVVMADGRLVHATETEHAELLWAARGAGPGYFGVVTNLYLRCRPKPGAMAHTTYVFPISCFDEVVTFVQDLLPTLDRRVEPVIAGQRSPLPDGSPAPCPYFVIHTTVMADSMTECAQLLAPFMACPRLDEAWERIDAAPTSLVEEGPMMDAQNPKGLRYHTDCTWTDAPSSELVPRLRAVYETLPTERSFCIWYGWSPVGALADMAFSMEGNVYVAVYAMNETEADDSMVRGWLNDRMNDLAPISKGLYLGDSDFTQRGGRFMSPANYERVEMLRASWDPDRRFVGYLRADHIELNEPIGVR